MLARKTWYLLAAVSLALGVWLAFQPQAILFSETERDGVVYRSEIECGYGVAMVFAGEFDPDVPGPSTQAACLRYGRTRVAEILGLAAFAGALSYVGTRYGKEPPRPLRTELPDLPRGAPSVEGRRRNRRD
ncbi:MAG TPA: hypothetical protein VMS74_13715 [Acidimicrobiia bacterium]|nr:hypothetical protein [Acidimicrobiia bacterium]